MPIAPPTISCDVFKTVLVENNSPAVGEAEQMCAALILEGGDPAFALAFFEHESGFGRAGVATVTKSVGNIRCSAGYECYQTAGNGSFRRYASWEAGAKDWAKLLRLQYRDQWKLSTIDQIIPVYAPNADNNNETAYIAGVKKRVDEFRGRHWSAKSQ